MSDGTYAAGVDHVTELLPSFMTDIINSAPEDQKVRFLERSHRAIKQSACFNHECAMILFCPIRMPPFFPCINI